MEYTLYGSQTSPFVRRLRLLLENTPYTFKEVNIFGEDRNFLNMINPINQIPILIDGDQKIWDSRQIFNYLNLIHRFQNMDWEEENLLTAIDGMMNSGVGLFLLKRSGVDISTPSLIVNSHTERIQSVLNFLKPYLSTTALEGWNFHTMSLYSFLDWALFRNIISINERPECQKFLESHAERTILKETTIPKVSI